MANLRSPPAAAVRQLPAQKAASRPTRHRTRSPPPGSVVTRSPPPGSVVTRPTTKATHIVTSACQPSGDRVRQSGRQRQRLQGRRNEARRRAAMPGHNDDSNGNSNVQGDEVGDVLVRLRHAAQHPPDALDAFRHAWCSLQPTSATPTSALEDHEAYQEAAEDIEPIFAERYLHPNATRDVVGFFSKIEKGQFRWHEALCGLRFYALFGHKGCSRTFIIALRQLEGMRFAHETSANEEHEAAEEEDGDGDNEHGLTFPQAWELLLEARAQRVTGTTVGRGISKRDEWRPVDCEAACQLAVQRFGMQSKTKQQKLGQKRRRRDTDETLHDARDPDRGAGEGQEEEARARRGDADGRNRRDNEPDRMRASRDTTGVRGDDMSPRRTPERGRERPRSRSRGKSSTVSPLAVDWGTGAAEESPSPRNYASYATSQPPNPIHIRINHSPSPTHNIWKFGGLGDHTISTHGNDHLHDDASFSLSPITQDRDTMGPRPVKRRASRSPGHNPGPISAFYEKHFAAPAHSAGEAEVARHHRRHLQLIAQFLASISPLPGPEVLEDQDLIVASYNTSTDPGESFVIGILAPRDHASWSVVYIDLVKTQPQIEIHTDHTSDADKPGLLSRLSPWLAKTVSPSCMASISAIPPNEYNIVELPPSLDLQTQHMPETLIKSLAVAVFLITNCDVPPGIFLWAWIGAMSTASAQHVRISEFQRSVELPDLGVQNRRAFDSGLQAQATDIDAFEVALGNCVSHVEILQTGIETLARFGRHLDDMCRCFRDDVYLDTPSACGDAMSLADIDKKLGSAQTLLELTDRTDSLYETLQRQIRALEEQKASRSTETPAHVRTMRELRSWSAISRSDADGERYYRVQQRDAMVASLQQKMKQAQDRIANLPKCD